MDWPKNVDARLRQAAFLTAAFYTSSAILQRISGFVFSMHGGRPYPMTVCWGLASTCCSLALAQRGLSMAPEAWSLSSSASSSMHYPSLPSDVPELISSASGAYRAATGRLRRELQEIGKLKPEDLPHALWSSLTLTSTDRARQEGMYQTLLGSGTYALLERRGFRTSLPSSIITTGVFAHTPLHWRWSRRKSVVIATGDAATDVQRRLMQGLGKMHGCHHCGSRQWLSGARFIADHMPPTKQVAEMNNRLWRRMLGLTAKQQLLPQCQGCFSVQGMAVKQGVHKVIYHSGLRVWHAAPALVRRKKRCWPGLYLPSFLNPRVTTQNHINFVT